MKQIFTIVILTISCIQYSQCQKTFEGFIMKEKEKLKQIPVINKINQDLLKIMQSPEMMELLMDIEQVKTKLTRNVSSECKAALLFSVENFGNYTLNMLDATGKPPPAIRNGAVQWVGGYDMCMSNPPPSNYRGPGRAPRSHYCRVNVGENPSTTILSLTPTVDFGVCAPETCSSDDIVTVIKSLLYEIHHLLPNVTIPAILEHENAYCMKRRSELPLTAAAVIMIVICCIFGAFMLAGTLFDIFVIRRRNSGSRVLKVVNSIPSEMPNENHADDMEDGLNYRNLEEEETNDKKMEIQTQTSPPPLHTWEKMLMAFSVYTNGSKLLETNQQPGRLNCLDGIRFLSMSWVILGHSYFFLAPYANNLGVFLPMLFTRWTYEPIVNATFSVDSFFLLSGMLTSYMFLKEASRMTTIKSAKLWVLYFFHRFWRLTPPYILFLGFYTALFTYFSEGPMFNQVGGLDKANCQSYWWTNLLYVNNIVDSKKMCMGWSWYLANDMQFHYFIAPLILPLIFLFGIWGVIPACVISTISFIVTGVISTNDKAAANLPAGEAFDDIYVKPWCRVTPYIVGLLLGYLVLEYQRRRWKLHTLLVVVGWLAAAGLCLSSLYGLTGVNAGHYKLSIAVSALYNSLARTAWSVGLAWLIFACLSGNGGWINQFLSWPGFIPLSRLTYCAYLVHPVVIVLVYQSLELSPIVNTFAVVYWFFGHMIAAYMVAFILSVTWESPLIGLEKILLRKG